MKPAFSVLFFTVSSGAGLGLMIWLAIARFAHSASPSSAWWTALAVATVLLTAGLLASTQHLANPKNAWRAFSRFATSWLSREGVFALAIYPFLALYALSLYRGWGAMSQLTGLLVIVLAFAILFCTAMIYACLKTIPRWHTWHTIALYPLFGLMSGALILMAMIPDAAALVVRWCAVVLLVAAAIVKLLYYKQFSAPGKISIASALKHRWGKPRLLDVGHTHQSFLTREFGFQVEPAQALTLKVLVLALAFALPLLLVLLVPQLAWLAALLCLAGLLLERWLFFAEARHVVNLYHGTQQV